jgi:hypothetical protein
MQNQITAASLPAVLSAIQSISGGAQAPGAQGQTPAIPDQSATADQNDLDPGDPGTPGKTPVDPGNWFNASQADSGVQARYFGAQAGIPTPQEQQLLQQAALLSQNDSTKGLAANLQARVQYGINMRKVASQADATNNYQAMVATTNAPEDRALDVLSDSGPLGRQEAAVIKKKFKDPEDQDAAARTWASHLAGIFHPFTGRDAKQKDDGTWIDAQTLQPIPGVARTGLTPDQEQQAYRYWNDPTPVPDGLGGTVMRTKWQASGLVGGPKYDSARDAIEKNRANGTGIAQQVQQGGQISPQQAATKQKVAAAVNQARGQQVAGQVNQAQNQIRAQALSRNAANEAQMSDEERTALADPQYKLANAPDLKGAGPGSTPSTVLAGTLKDVAAERTKLYSDSQSATSDGAVLNSYIDAAKAVLANPGRPPVGMGAGVAASVGNAMHALGITSGEYATRYQEVAKYLGNVAWTGLKASLPAGSRLNQMEFIAGMNQLNPATGQTPAAVNDLLDKVRSMSQYRIDSAGRAQRFLDSGGDPRKFQQYNNQYFNMSKAVNTTPTQTVRVIGPDGKGGSIPAARLQDYLAHGYKQAQ